MKKIVSLFLALALCLFSAVCFAESPALEVAVSIVNAADLPADFALIITPVEASEPWTADAYNEIADKANNGTLAELFGDLGGTYAVDEVYAVKAEGYVEGMGDVTAAIAFPTVYADGTELLVEISAQGGAYTCIPATAQNGAVVVTIPEDIIAQLNNGQGIIAVLSAQ